MFKPEYSMQNKLWNNSQPKFAPACYHAASNTNLLYFTIFSKLVSKAMHYFGQTRIRKKD